jgi:hypothetical protein
VVGSAASPGIFDTLEVVGRRRALARLDAALAFLGEQAASASSPGLA